MISNSIFSLLTGVAFIFHTPVVLAFAPSFRHRSLAIQMLEFSTSTMLNASVGRDDNNIKYESSSPRTEHSRRELFKSLPSTTAALAAMLGGTSSLAVRNQASAKVSKQEEAVLGPLNNLVGKWEGNQGFVLVSVPAPFSTPSSDGRFILIDFPYRETFEIKSIGPDGALNRGGTIDQVGGVCTYTKTVWATNDHLDDPDKQTIIHKENGMFFYLDNVTPNREKNSADPKDKAPFSIGRSAIIPHGNTAMMFGGVEEQKGAPEIPEISVLPFTTPETLFNLGYTDPYTKDEFNLLPTTTLRDALGNGPPVKNTVHFSLDSKNGTGGVLNTNFITKRADTRQYKADMWVQDLGNNKKQLQYAETASLFFHFNQRLEINWPHVMVNTLTKVD